MIGKVLEQEKGVLGEVFKAKEEDNQELEDGV